MFHMEEWRLDTTIIKYNNEESKSIINLHPWKNIFVLKKKIIVELYIFNVIIRVIIHGN